MFLIDLIIELVFDGIIEAWLMIMQWIVPEKTLGKYTRIILQIIVGIFTCLLLFIMLLGLFAIISDDPDTKLLGKYMVFIPLGISAVQIIIGIIVRIVAKKKNK